MYILGINAFYHDAAAALLRDGKVVAMVEEERFTRRKHAEGEFPHKAIEFCLKHEGISLNEIEYITFMHDLEGILANDPAVEPMKTYFSENPEMYASFKETFEKHLDYLKTYCKEKDIKLRIVSHHDCHLASAFFASDFNEANIISIDGRGDRETAVLAHGRGNSIRKLMEVPMPHSLGLIYTAVTDFLGFRPFDGEGKVMGLAPYGKDKFREIFCDMIYPTRDGFETKVDYYYPLAYGFINGTSRIEKMLGSKRPVRNNSINGTDENIACSLQVRTEEIVSHLADIAYSMTGCRNLCLAGGVALNAKMNGRLFLKNNIDNIFIQPIANDAGCALGGPMHLYNELTGKRPENMASVYLGPSYSNGFLKNALDKIGMKYSESGDVIKECANMIAAGKILGWFQGRMEVGPRALGNRSILADPSVPEMKDRINNKVKRREPWRPFAASILDDYKERYLVNSGDGPFMILNYGVTEEAQKNLASAIHIDSTTRPQTVCEDVNPLYYNLIREFGDITGVYGLLNTSFNLAGEPIVLTPEEAVKDFVNSDMDALVVGDFILKKQEKTKVFTGFEADDKNCNLSFDQYQRYKIVTDIINFSRVRSSLNILDIGSGPVDLNEFLPGDTITRMDMEEKIEEGYVCGSALDLPFQDGSFDVVISCDMFEHLKSDEREVFLYEIDRVSMEMIVIGCPFNDSKVEEAESLVNSFHKTLFGHENKWLIEHKEAGLPSLNVLLEWIHAKGYQVDVLHNGALDSWITMMYLNSYLERHMQWELQAGINNLYIHNIYTDDNYSPSYRNIVVARKTQSEKLKLPDSGRRKDISEVVQTYLAKETENETKQLFNILDRDEGKETLIKLLKSLTFKEYFISDFREKVKKFISDRCDDDTGSGEGLKGFIEPNKKLRPDILEEFRRHYNQNYDDRDNILKVLCLYLELKPNCGTAWNDLGAMLMEQGNLDEAKAALFNSCLLECPIAYRNLHYIYLKSQDTEGANKVMDEAIRKGIDTVAFDALPVLNGDSLRDEGGLLVERIKNNRSLIDKLQKDKEELAVALEKFVKYKKYTDVITKEKDGQISGLQESVNNYDERFKFVSELIQEINRSLPVLENVITGLNGNNKLSQLLVKLGELCFNFGSTESAKHLFEKIITLDPENSEALNNLGVINTHCGNYEAAGDLFAKSLASDPHNTEAKQNLVAVATITREEHPESESGLHIPVLDTDKIDSHHEYEQYVSQMGQEQSKRDQIEKSLINGAQVFTVEGYCYVCKKNVNFLVDYLASGEVNGEIIPNWRERVVCPLCWFVNRMRASMHLFEQLLKPMRESSIFITEQITPVYRWLSSNYSNVTGSEFLGESISFGENDERGIRNESLTALTFNNAQFDFILSFDVFEHIPEFHKAFEECFRVLKPGGSLLFSVPFISTSENNVVRAVVNENKEVEHLMPPEYHGDPLSDKGCLAFQYFGWEMLEQLRQIGFDDVSAQFYWSREFGYLGGDQIMFIARKKR